jgi:deazaflavin-dependent oxidoreductase (nitroreductase family)
MSTDQEGKAMTQSRSERNRTIIEEFRANGGRVSGQFGDTPLLLLTTTGAKSGQKRINPVAYLADGSRLLVFAANAGRPTHPDWYHNLVTHPDVTVEVGTERFAARAIALSGEERDRLYATQATLDPRFAEFQKKTTRTIPVVALLRIERSDIRSSLLPTTSSA